MYVKESGNWEINYIGRDYLGSITHVMDATGVVKQELSYDPWGRLRDPLTQALFELDKRLTLVLGDRGYTGHEHLQEFGLINMNARLYDPVVGRFLSPDPYVQAPDFSQNFNRYSYALNNPLRFTDPNGEFIHIVIGALIGGGINLIYKAATGQIHSWTDGFAAFGIGALAGGIGAATGGAAFIAAGGGAAGVGGIAAGVWGGIAGYMGSAPIQNVGNHLYFGDPLMSTGDYALGIAFSGLTGGITNGIAAKLNGKNIWNGKSDIPEPNPTAIAPTKPNPGKVEPLDKQYVNAQKPSMDVNKINDKQLYEIGDGVRRAKVSEMLGKEVIKAENATTGEILDISLDQLRSPKPYIDLRNSRDILQYNRAYDIIKNDAQKIPILVYPKNSNPHIPTYRLQDIYFKK